MYPTPITVDTPTGQHHTVGVHLTPTFDMIDGEMSIGDTVTVGPKLIPVTHVEDYSTPPCHRLKNFWKTWPFSRI